MGRETRSIWCEADGSVGIIDQTRLPHAFVTATLGTLADAAQAIRTMQVRGAPLIGATAAYGVALAMRHDPSDRGFDHAYAELLATRPTAVNLRWALDAAQRKLRSLAPAERRAAAYAHAALLCDEDVAANRAIGRHGLSLIAAIAAEKNGATVNVLTHCNAGALATVDGGTAIAPIYQAHDQGLQVHVWVDETRPRNQGAALTAWELGQHGVPHTVIADNAGGHLMQHGMVDLCIVGADRVSARGDVCNKIGTYLKALAAYDNAVPFYAALPSSTIDFTILDGLRDIPIEQRDPTEVTHIAGQDGEGRIVSVQLVPQGTTAANYGFDVTPAALVSGLVTDRGIVAPTREALAKAFPERVL